jgi:hypothetical protein
MKLAEFDLINENSLKNSIDFKDEDITNRFSCTMLFYTTFSHSRMGRNVEF